MELWMEPISLFWLPLRVAGITWTDRLALNHTTGPRWWLLCDKGWVCWDTWPLGHLQNNTSSMWCIFYSAFIKPFFYWGFSWTCLISNTNSWAQPPSSITSSEFPSLFSKLRAQFQQKSHNKLKEGSPQAIINAQTKRAETTVPHETLRFFSGERETSERLQRTVPDLERELTPSLMTAN